MGLGGPMWLASRVLVALAAVEELKTDPAQGLNYSVGRAIPDDFKLPPVTRVKQRLWAHNPPGVMHLEGSK
jgi:hypothetical protein